MENQPLSLYEWYILLMAFVILLNLAVTTWFFDFAMHYNDVKNGERECERICIDEMGRSDYIYVDAPNYDAKQCRCITAEPCYDNKYCYELIFQVWD